MSRHACCDYHDHHQVLRTGLGLLDGGCGVIDNENDRIPAQEQFADVTILIDSGSPGPSLASLGGFRPHFLDIFEESVCEEEKFWVGLDLSQQNNIKENIVQRNTTAQNTSSLTNSCVDRTP